MSCMMSLISCFFWYVRAKGLGFWFMCSKENLSERGCVLFALMWSSLLAVFRCIMRSSAGKARFHWSSAVGVGFVLHALRGFFDCQKSKKKVPNNVKYTNFRSQLLVSKGSSFTPQFWLDDTKSLKENWIGKKLSLFLLQGKPVISVVQES